MDESANSIADTSSKKISLLLSEPFVHKLLVKVAEVCDMMHSAANAGGTPRDLKRNLIKTGGLRQDKSTTTSSCRITNTIFDYSLRVLKSIINEGNHVIILSHTHTFFITFHSFFLSFFLSFLLAYAFFSCIFLSI